MVGGSRVDGSVAVGAASLRLSWPFLHDWELAAVLCLRFSQDTFCTSKMDGYERVFSCAPPFNEGIFPWSA